MLRMPLLLLVPELPMRVSCPGTLSVPVATGEERAAPSTSTTRTPSTLHAAPLLHRPHAPRRQPRGLQPEALRLHIWLCRRRMGLVADTWLHQLLPCPCRASDVRP